jgi:hypothetical protein
MLKIIITQTQWNNIIIIIIIYVYLPTCLRLINGLINWVGFESVVQIFMYNIL